MAGRSDWTPEAVAAELSGPGGLYGAVAGAARALVRLSGVLEGADREEAARACRELRGALWTMRGMARACGGFSRVGGVARGGCEARGSTRFGYDCPGGGE